MLAREGAAFRIDRAAGEPRAHGRQMRGQGRVEDGRDGGKVQGLAGQRGLHFRRQFDAVRRIAVLVQQLQRQQAVDDLVVRHVGAGGQRQRRDDGAAWCRAQGQASDAEGYRIARVANELALGIGAGLGRAAGHVIESFHRAVEEHARLRHGLGRLIVAVAAATGGQGQAGGDGQQGQFRGGRYGSLHAFLG
ncbi:hypothetical protein D3C81_1487840 [compost metagenome]